MSSRAFLLSAVRCHKFDPGMNKTCYCTRPVVSWNIIGDTDDLCSKKPPDAGTHARVKKEMTKQEMQERMELLREIYTEVRLLDAEDVQALREGSPTASEWADACYVGSYKKWMPRRCAAKLALETKQKQCRLEKLGGDIAHITACYCEVEGRPCVLELIQSTPSHAIMDPQDGESLMSEAVDYHIKLYQDPLTGAYNRRYYEEVVRKSGGPACVALMDLDDFKICNDTYSHHAGDLALETAVRAIRTCVRDTDMLIRYGGDEFLLIMPGFPECYLPVLLETICTRVREAAVPGYPHLHISLSIGGVMQNENEPMDSAVYQADRMMYQAKLRKGAVAISDHSGPLDAQPLAMQEQNKPQILIVDDAELNRAILAAILSDDYRILEAADGQQALDMMHEHKGDVALVLLDINMPVLNGFDVLNAMNRSHAIEDVPVIMISSDDSEDAIRRSYELGASDYISRPFDSKVVYRRVMNNIKLYAKQRRLVQMVSDQIRAREKNTTMLVGVLSQIVEFRNGESGSHVRHIRIITELLLGRLLELSTDYRITPEEQDDIPLASALHDIGKIAIDEKILNKPGRLTPEEFEVVKTHSMQGANMLHRLENFETEPLLQTAYEIARWHHERWDGRGYPDGLVGNEIPISAQIVSLADVYDALTSERCYKKAFSHEKAMQMILGGECGSFNPLLLQCLRDVQTELESELRSDYSSY